MTQQIQHLPTVADLYANKEANLKQTALAVLLNNDPAPAWIKTHPTTKTRYIPIEVVEYLLTRIFSKWRVEVKESKIAANSMVVTIRLHYIDPITGDWDWQDGIGAAPLQTNAGAGATDWNQIKSAAVMMAAPSAESFAVKDAAEKLGKIFGKDLNRKDTQAYDGLTEQAVKKLTPVQQRVAALIEDAQTPEQLDKLAGSIDETTGELFSKRREAVNGR